MAGYECLSRFPGAASPDRWFTQASRLGVQPTLEANVLRRALSRRAALPEGAFLTVNVSPASLSTSEVDEVLAAARPLTGVIVELTEHDPLMGSGDLAAALERIRDSGGLIALDDIGAGYSGLRWLLALRPDLIKIDRHFIYGIDQDEGKRCLVEMLAAFAGRIDAWALAEGIERRAELEVVRALGLPLGQGFLLGRPAPTWGAPPDDHAHRIRTLAPALAPTSEMNVGVLAETPQTVSVGEIQAMAAPLVHPAVIVDGDGLPVGFVAAGGAPLLGGRASLKVKASESVASVALRAIGRPSPRRWDPVLCVDAVGRVTGIIHVERLIATLAGRSNPKEGPDEAVRVW